MKTVFLLTLSASLSWASSVLPTDAHPLKLTYKFSDIRIAPGQEVNLDLPAGFQKLPLDFAFITHRQSPNEEKECRSYSDGVKIVDCLPAYTSFEVKDDNSPNRNEDWRYWGGSGSGPFNSKFAEVRKGQGETDNLYEWRKKGHYSVVTKSRSKNALVPAAFRIRSVGPDTLILQEVVVKFLPPKPTSSEEVVFSRGFDFGDYETAEGRKYPGRASVGDYGSALSFVRGRTPRHAQIPTHWKVEKGLLAIPLVPGKRLLFVDVAAGDMRPVPRGENPEAYRGGAKITIRLNDEVISDGENIGTSGVMRASPRALARAQNGDTLTLEIPKGSASIMGIRLGYDDL